MVNAFTSKDDPVGRLFLFMVQLTNPLLVFSPTAETLFVGTTI